MENRSAAFQRGVASLNAGQFQQAGRIFESLTRAAPDFAAAWHLRGVVAGRQGNPQLAVRCIQRAIDIHPRDAYFHHSLGITWRHQHRLDEALECFRRAAQLKPDMVEARMSLGEALLRLGRYQQAAEAYRGVLSLTPRQTEAHFGLAEACRLSGHLDAAAACYQRAAQLAPDSVEAHTCWGNVLWSLGKLDEAIACHQRALTLRPNCAVAASSLLYESLHCCHWRGIEQLARQVLDAIDSVSGGVSPFFALALDTSAQQQHECARQWVKSQLGASLRMAGTLAFEFSRPRRRRIRLGYLSAQFHDHAGGRLIVELIEEHDRADFEVFGYSIGPDDRSEIRHRLTKTFDRFVDIRDDYYVAAAQRIYRDEVDILIDLTGYCQDARTEILAPRPAPIQVNYLGYPGTMGAPFIDYAVVDAFIVPPAQQRFFSEQLVHLPGFYQANASHREVSAEAPDRAAYGLPPEGFVFCCFNNSYKITPEIFTVWMRLLTAVPGSALWLLAGNRSVPGNLRREAALRGVDPERLVFAGRMPSAEHLARHQVAGLFLDTFPVNAHTTASDSLWMGCPLLTMSGQTFASRVAGSLLRTLGLPELVTTSLQGYERQALELAQSPERLAEIRARLVHIRENGEAFGGRRIVRHLESAYRRMWNTYLAGQPPRTFSLVDDESRTS